MTPGPLLALIFLAMTVLLLPLWPWTRGLGMRPAISAAVMLTVVVLLWVTVFL